MVVGFCVVAVVGGLVAVCDDFAADEAVRTNRRARRKPRQPPRSPAWDGYWT